MMLLNYEAISNFLKRADLIQPRLTEDARVRTNRGGFLFVFAFLISTVLVTKSFVSYLSPPVVEYIEKIEVDTHMSTRMPIELNISFPRLSCLDVELVALDISGEAQLDVTSELTKIRLSPDGNRLGDDISAHLNRDKKALVEKAKATMENIECGSCYGANRYPNDCCRTCHDVKDRYSEFGWDVTRVSREAVQCLKEMDHPEIAVQPHEGCVLQGTISVNKVAGNVHVVLGTSRKVNGQLFHTFIRDQMGTFDTSHMITKLRFGEEVLEDDSHFAPLDGKSRFVDQRLGRTAAIQYLIHLIPTKTNGKQSYRLSTTEKYLPVLEPEHDKEITHSTNGKHPTASHMFNLPGVYFIYDFSPFVVVREPYQVSAVDLITDLLTVVGGIFALIRMLDSILPTF